MSRNVAPPSPSLSHLMRWPLDYAVAGALTLASFLLLYVRYWFPPEKIFDEVYFARAAEEYLQRRFIYESTHPPLSKLLITLSTWLFGGLHGGDTSYGWRFLDVVFGALMIWLLYALAKRITGSTLFSAYAAMLLGLDGMHFAQSRIATPESFVGLFSLATIYAFYRYWTAEAESLPRAALPRGALRMRLIAAGGAFGAGALFALIRFGAESVPAKILVIAYCGAGLYLVYRLWIERRLDAQAPPVPRDTLLWLLLFCVSIACLVTTKWYGVMAFGVAFTIVAVRPRTFRLDLMVATLAFVLGTVYGAAYTPQFMGLSDTPGAAPRAYTLSEVVDSQHGMFEYHNNLRATHPYASAWWQWPLDLRPVLYYANYGHDGHNNITTAAMIYSLPNPFILWFGLLCVPVVAYLAVRERNKAYVLVVLTYLLQWLPWSHSPRISFAYHFYVDIALTCLCIAIVMQRLWDWSKESDFRPLVRSGIVAYLAAVFMAFCYFFPELAGLTIPYGDWSARLWLSSWI